MATEGDLIAERYKLVRKVGSGAMGTVWQARDQLLRRDVAVKELLVRTGMTELETDEARNRAMREARIAARLHHPNVISIYDVVEYEGRPCLIMEYLPSSSLSDLIAEHGVLPVGTVARIGAQIAGALSAAHTAGIVHRDVKPANVLLTGDNVAKLTDFGISRADGDATLTAAGLLAGTPAYLPPEVAQGEDAIFASEGSGDSLSSNNLTATSRSSRSSRASQTTPIAPRPICVARRYRSATSSPSSIETTLARPGVREHRYSCVRSVPATAPCAPPPVRRTPTARHRRG